MEVEEVPFTELLSKIVDNRGRTCPTAESGLPLIATNCVRNDLLYPAFEKVRYVSKDTYDNWFRGHPEPGDLIFVCKGTPGRVCMTPDPVSFCIAQDMVAVRADPEKVYPKYLFALLRSQRIQTQIGNMHVGTLIPHFKKGDFNKLLLPVPTSRKIQETIGDVFFELSAKIELNRQMNATLEAMARTLFQSWFVDFDPVRAKLDGHEPFPLDSASATIFPEHFAHSDHNMIPVGWRLAAIRDVCAINAWTLGKSDDFETLEYVEISEVSRGNIANIATYPRGEEPSRARRRLRHGDTVLSTVRPDRGSYFLALNPPENRVASTGFAVLTPTKVPWSFLHAALTQPEVSDHLGQMADGGAYPAVRPEVIGAIQVAIPSEPKILEAFHRLCAPLFERAEANRTQSRTLATLRDALLPKLLGGELSVNEPNAAAS